MLYCSSICIRTGCFEINDVVEGITNGRFQVVCDLPLAGGTKLIVNQGLEETETDNTDTTSERKGKKS
jgi:hypothetical protein